MDGTAMTLHGTFCKYLVNEKGNLTHFFESSESPKGKNILAAIEE